MKHLDKKDIIELIKEKYKVSDEFIKIHPTNGGGFNGVTILDTPKPKYNPNT